MTSEHGRKRTRDHGLFLPVLQVIGLGSLWLVFSGKLDLLHALFGVLSIGLVVWRTNAFVVPRGRPEESRALASIRPLKLISYTAWLVKEIVVANIDIAKIIIKRDMPVDPALVRFESGLSTDLARVMLGNSITLTPGTLTVEIDGRQFLVHGISEGGATGPVIDEMQRKLAELFGEEPPPPVVYRTGHSIAAVQGRRR